MSEHSRRIAGLSQDKLELLAQRLKRDKKPSRAQTITRRADGGPTQPLSFAQERLWFLDQFEPNSPSYNIPAAVRLEGRLDVAAMGRGLNQLINRHESLRTTFTTQEGRPVQVIGSALTLPLPLLDLREVSESEQDLIVQQLSDDEARKPFNLSQGPLLRTMLVRLGEDLHVIILVMHHIISDGWSMGLFVAEWAAYYDASLSGTAAALPELPIQYADFAVWQRQWLQGDQLNSLLSYWKQQLKGAPGMLELPADRLRPAVATSAGAREYFALSEIIYNQLLDLSRQQGVTLFMVLLAAFKTLLFRYSRQEDMVVGTPIAGRTLMEIERLIGFFLNSLALRTELSGDLTFKELLGRVRDVTLDAYAHQSLPFEKLVDELHLERDLSRTPLFQVMFILQNTPEIPRLVSGLKISFVEVSSGTAKFDLTLSLAREEAGLSGVVKYRTDLFNRSTIKRVISHFQTVLEAIVADPDQRLSTLPLLRDDERQQVLVEWNRTDKDYAETRPIHELFEQQAERTPKAVAVAFEGQEVAYEELNAKANKLAHYLRGNGVGPESLVGICLDRSVELVIGLMAILKAGAAYVPIDPGYPRERIAYMLEDSRVPVLLTQRRLENLPPHAAHIVRLDSEWERIAGESEKNPLSGVRDDNLAYVIYTSGSTGRPKGAMNTHAAFRNRLLWMQEAYRLNADDRVLQKTPFSFDVSVWEFFWPLMTGARLVVAKPGGHQDSGYLTDVIKRQGITTLHFVPSMLQIFLDEPGVEACATIKRVISSGEALSLQLQEKFYKRLNCELHNLYGPTEAAIDVTSWKCEKGSRAQTVPIGKPISNIHLYILDESLQAVAVGVSGEMYIAGEGLGRGYLHQAEQTAARFVPNPYSRRGGERMYRTGDVCRYQADGEIEYLGRLDQQVKVRGYRIELGEIEEALLRHAQVREAVVVAREDQAGGKRLVGYVVGEETGRAEARELREYLKGKLPEYMVPGVIIELEEMPKTPNGKLDRARLPEPDVARPEMDKAYVPPRTTLEDFLTGMWQEFFGIERIGINDNFFDLGGDSIRGAIFINRLQEKLGEYIYVVALFDAPTIAELAQYLKTHYVDAVARFGIEEPTENGKPEAARIDEFKIAHIRTLIEPLPPAPAGNGAERKNPPAVFILSPPRSGSTLLRVMLAGHPKLFAPPELELLCFNTLEQRQAAFSGRNSFSLEGTIRAIMEIKECDAQEAISLMQACQEQKMTTQQFYFQMQQWIDDRFLVDKSPSYAMDLETLRRAEAEFANALYIHLLRHPYGMIRSFEEAKLDQVFFRYKHPFTTRELAELIWTVSQQNILELFNAVPQHRQHRVRFEDLLKHPEPVLEGICDFLGLEFHPDMLEPYKNKEKKMTDGLYAVSRMLGDVKFHEYKSINVETANRWKQQMGEDPLGDITWDMAEALGYKRPSSADADNQTRRAPPIHKELTALKPILRDATANLPLSFAQQRLWFLDQMEPGSPLYNIPAAVRLSGKLNVAALRRSINEVIRRHEILRTSFPSDNGQAVQHISPELVQPLAIADLREKARTDREIEALAIANEQARLPFNLSQGPLLRIMLVQLDEDEHVALLTMHHIISDGWSIGILVRELAELYAAYSIGKPSPLPELDVQYGDFAAWQREWLQGEILEEQLAYWRQQLGDNPPSLDLPTDHARPALQTFNGGRERLSIEARLGDSLRELSRREGATMFMVLLAAFKVLLYRYSGQTDLAVGTPVAGRNRLEIEPLIGFFVNTLVLRTRLQPQASFRQLLAAVKQVCLSAWAHQEIPFEKLVEQLQPQRDMSRSPLFQVMFALQNAADETLSLPGLTMSAVKLEGHSAKFDLTLTMAESGAGVAATLEYNADLYQAATIQRMSRHLQNLLEAIADDPNQPVGELQLMSDAELQQVLVQWNQTHRDYPQEGCIHELFEQQAARTPQQVAVVFDKQEISYGQLNQRANQLANYLVSLGVEAESLVGLCLERSVEMIVGLLAILKAGGAYVPLDASYPAERLAYLMGDAGLSLLLTQASLQEQLPETAARRVVVEQEQEAIARQSGDNLGRRAESQNLAYVIYTSGSTGKPKGVAIEHRAVVNFLTTMQQEPGIQAGDKLLAVTTLSFDIAGLELWLPLMVGAEVALASREQARDGQQLAELIKQRAATLMQATPSSWRMLLESGWEGSAELKVLCGGEELSRELGRKLAESAGEVWNLYGPTETTIWSTKWRVQGGEGGVKIGRPIGNTAVYVLDERQQPVAVGVSGEIYIAGEGLGRGYLHEAEQTAARFVPNPYSRRGGERMYRTGDVCRYQGDGEIEYLGRLDQQVKVRGYRIELGEIEEALLRHAQVREAVVVAREDQAGGKRLVGYVVAEETGRAEARELREYVKGKLPEYMVPGVIIELEEMPKTPNGKLDRRRLAEEEGVSEEGEASYEEARTAVEEVLVEIWGELLAVPRVGVSDNFFALGGHSLLATQLASRLKNRFELTIPLRSLFEKPTVSEMALLIEKALMDEIDGFEASEIQHMLNEDR